MYKNLLKKNINIFSFILLLLGHFFLPRLWFIGAFIFIFVIVPVAIVITLIDAILNKDSCITNLIFLLATVYFVENIFVRHDLNLYFCWLIGLLVVLIAFNILKKNKIAKYSTILVICFAIVFRIFIQIPGDSPFNKNIFNKVGHHTMVCKGGTLSNCKNFKIPRQYDDLKYIISGGFCPVFRGIKEGQEIFIDHTNKNILPDVQEAEYLGYCGRQGMLFFKIKKNNKYGLYVYDSDCKKEGFLPKENALKVLIPPIYDEMTIVKSEEIKLNSSLSHYVDREKYEAPNNNEEIIAIIVKKENGYHLYIRDEYGFKYEVPFFQNKRNIKFIRTIHKMKQSINQEEYHFEVDGNIKNFNTNKGKRVFFGKYNCSMNGDTCKYEYRLGRKYIFHLTKKENG